MFLTNVGLPTRLLPTALLLLATLPAASLLHAATNPPQHTDLAADYLAGLRQRGWHDVALEYLDTAAEDPLATPAFLDQLGYQRATTQADLARQAAGGAQRQTLLAEAAAGFQEFAAQHSDSPQQLQALATAGNLFTELALYATTKAEKLPAAAQRQRERLQNTARGFLEQARQPLQALLKQCDSQIQALPKAADLQKNPRPQGGRQLLEAKQAEAKFLLAKLDFEKARTYAPDSKAHHKVMETAAAAFAKLYQDYDQKLVGFYGRLYQGRSYQAAGDFKQALACYWDIVDQPPIANQDFRRLVARAHRYRAECHLTRGDPSSGDPSSADIDQTIKECTQWLDESHGPELNEPDWLAVAYQLARAYEAKAESASGSEVQKLRTEARKQYREIAQHPGEFQRDARARMTTARGSGDKRIVVKTFDEALSAGKASLEQMNSAKLTARLARENNPDSVDALNAEAAAYQTAASQYFRQAIELADAQTDREQLANAQYYVGWLYWEAGRWHDAAVMGRFLARRYPESEFAPVAAKLALAAYERLYNAAKKANESTDFEARHLTEVAELLALRWPESPEAATGLNLLINIALRDDRTADAEAMLQRLPSSSRGAAELRLGGAIWTRYLNAGRNAQGGPDDAALSLKKRAGELLASGYQSLQNRPAAVSQTTASEAIGVLYYAQYLLAKGDAEQAVAVLENSSIGPLSQIERQSPAAKSADFVQKTQLLALRAYVSLEPPRRDKAQEMMTALEASIGSEGKSQQKLINIYVHLGLELQRQISELTAEGQTEKARAVAASFEDLIARVTERAGAADDWRVQNWIAQSNLQLGQGLRGDDAARYYQQAEQAYLSLLSSAEKDPKFAPSPLALLATKKRLADCLQAQEKYAEAFQQYTSILQEKPNMLELQQAAVTALQQWGTKTNDAKKIEASIRGAEPQANKKNLVWGWLRLASIADQAKRKAEKRTADDPAQARKAATYTNLYFEARYHVAEARFATAKLATGDVRKKRLDSARQSLESMQRLYPQLGGPRWQQAYQELLEQMEAEK